jgi:hypothetical protein
MVVQEVEGGLARHRGRQRGDVCERGALQHDGRVLGVTTR